jgi:hypothetical protein
MLGKAKALWTYAMLMTITGMKATHRMAVATRRRNQTEYGRAFSLLGTMGPSNVDAKSKKDPIPNTFRRKSPMSALLGP